MEYFKSSRQGNFEDINLVLKKCFGCSELLSTQRLKSYLKHFIGMIILILIFLPKSSMNFTLVTGQSEIDKAQLK